MDIFQLITAHLQQVYAPVFEQSSAPEAVQNAKQQPSEAPTIAADKSPTQAVSHNPMYELTKITLQNLEDAVALNALNARDKKAKFEAMLPELQKNTALLYTAGETMEKRFKEQAATAQNQLETILKEVGRLETLKREQEGKINDLEAKTKNLEIQIADTEQMIAEKAREEAQTQVELEARQTEDGIFDIVKFIATPATLIAEGVRNAVVGTAAQKEEELQRQRARIAELRADIEKYIPQITQLKTDLETTKTELKNSMDKQNTCETQQKAMAQQVAFCANITAFYLMLKNSIEGIGTNLKRLANVDRRLKETIDYHKADGSSTTIIIKEALLELATQVNG